jgi:hypothetical protein
VPNAQRPRQRTVAWQFWRDLPIHSAASGTLAEIPPDRPIAFLEVAGLRGPYVAGPRAVQARFNQRAAGWPV